MAKRTNKKPKMMARSTAYKLIGEFIFHWNLLEGSLDQAVISLSKLDPVHGRIMTANLNFQTKMHIVTTLIQYLGEGKPKAWKKSATDTIKAIHVVNNNWRTTVVHNLIDPIDMRSVKFLKVSAKGKLHWPDTTKTKQEFREVCVTIAGLWQAINKISEDLVGVDLAKVLAAAPLPSGPPMLGFPPLGHSPPIAGLGTQLPGMWSGGLFGNVSADKGSKE